MSQEPLVTICIPVYNGEKYISFTIESALQQTYRNIEIIVTDNCSEDSTYEIVKSFKDTRISYFKNDTNLGVESNWNRSLSLANGKYIKLLCADDILYSDCITLQVAVLENPVYSKVVLVSANKNIIDQKGKILLSKSFPGNYGLNDGILIIKRSIRFGTNIIGEPASGLFRANALSKSGLYNARNLYLIDLDFWSRLLLQGDLYVIDKILYGFRISTDSLSTDIGFSQAILFNKFVKALAVDNRYNITIIDKIFSRFMSVLMVVARNILYLIYFKRT